jgi:ribonuclease P/MRP protein subunit POP1
MCCVEIQGPQNEIICGLVSLCDPKTGPTFGASAFLNGTREGRVIIFKRNNFSSGPIGLVTFLWCNGGTPDMRNLWIWSHPAFYQQLLCELSSIFDSDSDSLSQHVGVKVILNKGKLNRFRLRGPSAHSVVSSLFSGDSRSASNLSQSPGFVTSVEVRDPRMILAQSRTKQNRSIGGTGEVLGLNHSKLWDASVRDQITDVRTTLPDHIINNRRSQLLVPGSELPVQPDEIPIPLLIVNASHESNGKGKYFVYYVYHLFSLFSF